MNLMIHLEMMLLYQLIRRRRNDIRSWGGGANFGSQKWRVSAGRRAYAMQGGCLRGDVPHQK